MLLCAGASGFESLKARIAEGIASERTHKIDKNVE